MYSLQLLGATLLEERTLFQFIGTLSTADGCVATRLSLRLNGLVQDLTISVMVHMVHHSERYAQTHDSGSWCIRMDGIGRGQPLR